MTDATSERPVSARPGDGALARAAHLRDSTVGRWDPTSPSATQIGRARDPNGDVSERLRRLHEERHPATEGHGARQHRLEKLRITQALCNDLDVTPWQRDRALGVMIDLDLTAFGSQRAIEKVALVVIQYVVDEERQRQLGLHDDEWLAERSPDELEGLFDRFDSMSDDPMFKLLADAVELDSTSVNRLDRVLRDQIDEQGLHGAALGRSPYRDPALPAIHRQDSGRNAEDAPSGDA